MGNGVVSIRVEGVSITIVDGNIAIEQTRPPATAPRVETASSEVARTSAAPAQPAPTDGAYIPEPAADGAGDISTTVLNPERPLLNGAARRKGCADRVIARAYRGIEQSARRAAALGGGPT